LFIAKCFEGSRNAFSMLASFEEECEEEKKDFARFKTGDLNIIY